MKMKTMFLFVCAPFLISKKAVSCTWEGQSIRGWWYSVPATASLAGRCRGPVTTLRNKRCRVILFPIQRQQKSDRNRARKQSGESSQRSVQGKITAYMKQRNKLNSKVNYTVKQAFFINSSGEQALGNTRGSPSISVPMTGHSSAAYIHTIIA